MLEDRVQAIYHAVRGTRGRTGQPPPLQNHELWVRYVGISGY